MAAQWPRVAAWLVATLPTLPGWADVTVYDGAPVTADSPPNYITVGYVEGDSAGMFTTVQDPDGFQRQETGTVRSALVSQGGNPDTATYRDAVFTLADALDVKVRADRTLGGTLAPESTSDLTVDVQPSQDEYGAAVTLVLTLSYFTVT